MNSSPTTTHDETPPSARRAVASYRSYRDAEQAVNYLADNRFPVERVAIVGRELELVQQVTGRLTAVEAAARGALTGAVTGVLIGWLFAIFSWFDPRIASGWLIIDALWFGTLVGIVMGLFMYLITRSRRRFDAIAMMQPEYFDIAVDELYADDAARMLLGFSLPSRVPLEPPSTVKSASPTPRPTPAT
jgi:hypothetical protein